MAGFTFRRAPVRAHLRTLFRVGVLLAVMCSAASVGVVQADEPEDEHEGEFNQPGNLLISDQFNNRVVEVDRLTARVTLMKHEPYHRF